MPKEIINFFFILLTGFSGICQNRMQANFETIQNLPPDLARHIPEGFAAMDTISGYLNGDEFRDMIMVLKNADEDTIFSRETKRPLLLLIGLRGGSLKLVEQNDNVVYCISCGGAMGDPYQQTIIQNGYFSVVMQGGTNWRWTRTITFKYSKKESDWLLHTDSSTTFHANDPETTAKDYVATVKELGKIKFSEFNYQID